MELILEYIKNPIIQKLLWIIIGTLIILTLGVIVKGILTKKIHQTNKRYKARKLVTYTSYFLILFLIFIIYSSQLTGLSVFIGVAGAGIAFALQEVIASIAGFVAINFSNFYKIGDRVMLGGIKGDVIDIGVLRTSLMQIGDWVDGDLYNGKIVRIANSFIFKEPVFNYSGDFPFLWDEVIIPIRTNGDIEYGRSAFLEILNRIQGPFAKGAEEQWLQMTEKMMLENAKVEPMVTISFDENWVSYTLRFVVDFKKRRTTKDLIYTEILSAIEKSNGKLSIASSSLEVVNFNGDS